MSKHQGCKFLNVFYGRHFKKIGDERFSRKAGGHNSLHYSASVKVLARHLKGHPSLRLLDSFLRKNSFTALQLIEQKLYSCYVFWQAVFTFA